jgi:hypothetical protein
MTIAGKTYTEKKDAAELLHGLLFSTANIGKVVAKYKGFEIIPDPIVFLSSRTATVRGNGEHRLDMSESAIGTLTRLDNLLERFEDGVKSGKERLITYGEETEAAKAEISRPFEHAERLAELTLELERINGELNLDNKDIEPVIDDTKFQNEIRADADDTDTDLDDGDGGGRMPIPPVSVRENRQNEYEMG